MSTKKADDVSSKSQIHGHLYSKENALLNGAKVSCNELETVTLADGFYVFDNLPSGNYRVVAELKGFQSETKQVSLRDNDVIVLDFYLSKALGTAKIRGRVYDKETGEPILSGGTIILILPVSNKYADIDVKGYYEFENLSADTYSVSTSIPKYDDIETILTVSDGETVTHDFFCIPNKDVEPAWG